MMINPSVRRSRALVGVPVPHHVILSQQHVAADAGGLSARFLRGVGGIGDDDLAEQSAIGDVGKRGGDPDRIRESRSARNVA